MWLLERKHVLVCSHRRRQLFVHALNLLARRQPHAPRRLPRAPRGHQPLFRESFLMTALRYAVVVVSFTLSNRRVEVWMSASATLLQGVLDVLS